MKAINVGPHITYQEFEANRSEILNLKEEKEFKEFFK
jgi:hypothetical protein